MAEREIELEIPQGITTRLYHWDDKPTAFSAAHTIEAVTQFWSYLYPVVRPLSADLWLDNFDAKLGYPVRTYPELSMWHLQVSNPPIDCPIEAGMGGVQQIERAELLTPSSIAAWLAKAIDQKATAEDMSVGIRQVAFYNTCVRLLIDEQEYDRLGGKISFVYPTRKTLIDKAPIQSQAGNYWVAGRTKEILKAPISVDILNEGGTGSDLRAHITIHWSFWASSQHQEGQMLQKAISDLISNTNWSAQNTAQE